MKIPLKGELVVNLYGGKPFLSGMEGVTIWLEDQQDRLLHPRYRELKNAIGNEKKLEEILSILNVDENGFPIIGSWMVYESLKTSAKLTNVWGKFQVPIDRFMGSININPDKINLYNGKLIKKPDGVETYAVSLPKEKKSFFKAYQFINAGATFEMELMCQDDICEKASGKGKKKIFEADPDKTKECVLAVLDKMQNVGLGAFRTRYGKFKWVK